MWSPRRRALRGGWSLRGRLIYHGGDLLDEEQWRLLSQATAAAGVATALSLPIVREDRVFAGIKLHAGSEDAFDGHHEKLAGLAGGWAARAVANADLSFSARLQAAEARQRLREQNIVDQAVGVLAAPRTSTRTPPGSGCVRPLRAPGSPKARPPETILALLTP